MVRLLLYLRCLELVLLGGSSGRAGLLPSRDRSGWYAGLLAGDRCRLACLSLRPQVRLLRLFGASPAAGGGGWPVSSPAANTGEQRKAARTTARTKTFSFHLSVSIFGMKSRVKTSSLYCFALICAKSMIDL